MYSIYRITSPSGRYYIGLTKNPIKERWRQHITRAFTEHRNHPFYNAIRKYGPDNFTVEQIDTAADKPEAQKKEMWWIANSPKAELYNLSPGGEADGETGSHIFWGEIRKNPEKLSAYLEKLSRVKKDNDWSDYEELSRKAEEWKHLHPREAYRVQNRATRVARRKALRENPPRDPEPELTLKERLRRKYKRSEIRSEITREQWAARTEEEVREVGSKISESNKKHWQKITDPEERSRLTADARAAIDRKKQGAAASAGIKKFWADLKSNPERYRDYMERRTAKLNETIKKKQEQGIRPNERWPESPVQRKR